MTTITRGWPPSRRAAQARRIRQTRPWLKSTGPRTATGKAASARNAYRHGFRTAACQRLAALLRWQRRLLKATLAAHAPSGHPVNFPSLPLIPGKSLANIPTSFKRQRTP